MSYKDLKEFVQHLHGVIDVEISERLVLAEKKDMPVTCKKGCDACCRIKATITEPEAILLAEWVLKQPDWGDRLNHAANQMKIPFLTNAEWAKEQIECMFLKDHACEVYGIRPTACRTHFAVSDPANCSIEHSAKFKALNCLDIENIFWQFALKFDFTVAAPIQIAVIDAATKIGDEEQKHVAQNLYADIPSMSVWMNWEFAQELIAQTKGENPEVRRLIGEMLEKQ